MPADYAGREVWVRQTEDTVVISEQDYVLAEHRLAERRCERSVIPAHFQALAARRDRRLQWEAAQAFAAVAGTVRVVAGPEVQKRSLAVYEDLA